ncbi:MAG: DUF6580 family putative transport protein [Saprospiraceae bacterium]
MKKIPYFNLVLGLLLGGILSRLIPHIPNFTALGATALFAGALLQPKWIAYFLPLMALWISDLFLNNGMYKNMYPEAYTGWVWMGNIWVYISFFLITLLGRKIITKIGFKSIFISGVSASLIFFLLTNFGVWYHNPIWPQNLSGLFGCYIFAIPFFWNTLAGDLIFSGMIFGIYIAVVQRKSIIA